MVVSLLALLLLIHAQVLLCNGGVTSYYVRRQEKSVDMPLHSDVFGIPHGYNAPQQVHITQGDHDGSGIIISWVTEDEPGSNVVHYGTSQHKLKFRAQGMTTRYKYYSYASGYIHHCTLKNLKYKEKYFYELGRGNTTRLFWFTTPPRVGPDVPYTFGVIGDLGQTYDSNITLSHYEANPKAQAVLYVGDLSYADNHPAHDNRRWDTWARFVERNIAYHPWIWTAGNHEIDYAPEYGEMEPFKPYLHRYHVPYRASNSSSPLWYSVKRASAYVIVLSSYSAYGMYTPQYQWLLEEFPKVNRSETPWLIVLMHSPWYNSNSYHYMEGETMRVMFEAWFVQYKVDVVFAGHVHAYERSERTSNIDYNIVNGQCSPVPNNAAPVYITIGDGGNIEGLADKYHSDEILLISFTDFNAFISTPIYRQLIDISLFLPFYRMTEPQPKYSAFRESSFGHAIFDIRNRTHAHYAWHRNHDSDAVVADSMWFHNRYWFPVDEIKGSSN